MSEESRHEGNPKAPTALGAFIAIGFAAWLLSGGDEQMKRWAFQLNEFYVTHLERAADWLESKTAALERWQAERTR